MSTRDQLRDAVIEAAKARCVAIKRFEDFLDGNGDEEASDDLIKKLTKEQQDADEAICKTVDALEAHERGGGT